MFKSEKVYCNVNGAGQLKNMTGGKGFLLMEVTQHQNIRVEVAMKDQEVVSLDGPLDLVNWDVTKHIGETVIQALVRTGLIDPADIFMITAMIRNHQRQTWNPCVSLYCRRDDLTRDTLQLIEAVIQETLEGMSHQSNPDNVDAFKSELSGDLKKHIEDVVSESLLKVGGRSISHPIQVHCLNLGTLILQKRFARKPSKASYKSEMVQLNGMINGFNDSHEKHVIFFQSEEKGLLEIAFKPKMNGEKQDLLTWTRWHIEGQRCKVEAGKTISSSGCDQYTLVCIIPNDLELTL